MKILLVKDASNSSDAIISGLRDTGVYVNTTIFNEHNLNLNNIRQYSAIVLDLVLPSITSFEIMLRFKSAKIKIPLILLSDPAKITYKVGLDEYITNAANTNESIACILAVIGKMQFDKISINFDKRIVKIDDEQIHLTNMEYAILELLARRKGTIVTRDMLLNHLYPSSNDMPEYDGLKVFICRLREKLAKASGGINYIKNIHGFGYKLKI